ncbi:hypothetical protein OV079_25065 [Nannocystis pusilla]|uniref:Uncharacterized protein n=1 Tax=Nannocystis pusilla TaxID=889268 RepID=A0A9X3EST6_9BACT|nr:hypothetical protein [Nannocystis pusilla]MCY1008769.1 hypothetical protein [Nannocystis pusilla]
MLAGEAVGLGVTEGGKQVLLPGGGGVGREHDEHGAVVARARRTRHAADRADARVEAVADLEGVAGTDARRVLAVLGGELGQGVAAVAGVDQGVLERLPAAHQRGRVLCAEDPAEDRVGAEIERVNGDETTAGLVGLGDPHDVQAAAQRRGELVFLVGRRGHEVRQQRSLDELVVPAAGVHQQRARLVEQADGHLRVVGQHRGIGGGGEGVSQRRRGHLADSGLTRIERELEVRIGQDRRRSRDG